MKIVVVGGGQVGSHVAELLVATGCQVTIVEVRAGSHSPGFRTIFPEP